MVFFPTVIGRIFKKKWMNQNEWINESNYEREDTLEDLLVSIVLQEDQGELQSKSTIIKYKANRLTNELLPFPRNCKFYKFYGLLFFSSISHCSSKCFSHSNFIPLIFLSYSSMTNIAVVIFLLKTFSGYISCDEGFGELRMYNPWIVLVYISILANRCHHLIVCQ